MVNTEKKPSIGKSIRKGIETVRSFASTVRKTLNDMRPKRKFGKLAVLPSKKSDNTNIKKKSPQYYYVNNVEIKDDSHRGGKQSGKKTKRNMRKRGTQKRR